MRKVNLFLTAILFIATAAVTAQTDKPLLHKSKIHQREAISSKERTLSNDKSDRLFKPETHRAMLHKNTANAALRLDSSTIGGFCISYEYDSNGKVIFENEWYNGIHFSKYEYTYDEQGNLILSVENTVDWDNRDQLVEYEKKEYEYDEQGNQILYINYRWNTSLNQWVAKDKYEYTYNAQSNLIFMAYYHWNNQWEISSKYEYEYDEQGNDSLIVYYYWDSNLKQFILSSKSEYECNEQGNRTLSIGYDWDKDSNQWAISDKIEYKYDEQGNLILYTYYRWDSDVNQLFESTKYEYTYDEHGNMTLRIDYNWDYDLSQLVGYFKRVSDYNLSYTCEDAIVPDNEWWKVNKNIVMENIHYYWDESLSDWGEPYITTYHYSGLETGISEHTVSTIKVYPNPAQHTLYIESAETVEQVSVYDISGRMLQQTNNPNTSIDVSNLANGIYLVKVKTAHGETSHKIIKN